MIVLEKIGGFIDPTAKERAIDSINNWIILKNNLNQKCKLPENALAQDIQIMEARMLQSMPKLNDINTVEY